MPVGLRDCNVDVGRERCFAWIRNFWRGRTPIKLSDVLAKILEERQARNSSYSLRALARDLGLNSGTLSRLMREESDLSLDAAKKLLNASREHFDHENEFQTLVLTALLEQAMAPLLEVIKETGNTDLHRSQKILKEIIERHMAAGSEPL